MTLKCILELGVCLREVNKKNVLGHSQPVALFVGAACPAYIGSVGCVGHMGVWGRAEFGVDQSVGYIRVLGVVKCGV